MSVFVTESDRKWVRMCACVCMYEQETLHLSLDSGGAVPESFCVCHAKGHVLNFHRMWQSDLSDHPVLISHITELYIVYNSFDLCTRWAIRGSFKIHDHCGTER